MKDNTEEWWRKLWIIMSARKIIKEHCEHAWEFSCVLDGMYHVLTLDSLNFTNCTPKATEELFQRLKSAFETPGQGE